MMHYTDYQHASKLLAEYLSEALKAEDAKKRDALMAMLPLATDALYLSVAKGGSERAAAARLLFEIFGLLKKGH